MSSFKSKDEEIICISNLCINYVEKIFENLQNSGMLVTYDICAEESCEFIILESKEKEDLIKSHYIDFLERFSHLIKDEFQTTSNDGDFEAFLNETNKKKINAYTINDELYKNCKLLLNSHNNKHFVAAYLKVPEQLFSPKIYSLHKCNSYHHAVVEIMHFVDVLFSELIFWVKSSVNSEDQKSLCFSLGKTFRIINMIFHVLNLSLNLKYETIEGTAGAGETSFFYSDDDLLELDTEFKQSTIKDSLISKLVEEKYEAIRQCMELSYFENGVIKPVWNAAERKLYLGDKLVREMNRSHAFFVDIIQEFARQNWTEIIKMRGLDKKQIESTCIKFNETAVGMELKPLPNCQVAWKKTV